MNEEAFSVFEGILDALVDVQSSFREVESMDVPPEEWEEIDVMIRALADLVDSMDDFYMDHVRRDARWMISSIEFFRMSSIPWTIATSR